MFHVRPVISSQRSRDVRSKGENRMPTPDQKIASLKKKLEDSEQESTERGIALTWLNDLVDRLPMPDPTRMLLQRPLKSYIDRCTDSRGLKGKK